MSSGKPGKVIDKLVDVISEFEVLDKEYRIIHSQAVDIDDIDQSKRIQDQTYQRIRKLKEWKETINRLSEEIEQHLYIFWDHQEGQAGQPAPAVDEEAEEPEVAQSFPVIEKEPELDEIAEEAEEPEVAQSFPVADEGLDLDEITDEAEKLEVAQAFLEAEESELDQSMPVIEKEPELGEIADQAKSHDGPMIAQSFQLFDQGPDQLDDRFVVDSEAVFDDLPDQHDHQGPQPVSLILFGSSEPIDGWSQVLFKFCQSLLFRRPYSVARLDQEAGLNQVTNFSYQADGIRGDKERLSNGLWVSKANGKEETLKLCHAILQLTGYSQRDFIITYG